MKSVLIDFFLWKDGKETRGLRSGQRKVISCVLYLEAVPRAVIQAWKMPAKKEKGFFLVTTK